MWNKNWLVLWSLWAARVVINPTALVQLSDGGWVRGTISPDGNHLRYTGIPYAKVTRRFQPAEPNPQWKGIFDAKNENIRCVQRFFGAKVMGTEDCLIINVFTPNTKYDQPLPVMVFIHGGGFRDGSASPMIYGPNYLTKHGVILVTFNYRLEILGFLSLGIKEAPGNMGMKDQVEALKWVQRNIRSFGGDPDNVTIFGESAGAASVNYHLLSPMSKGLFHKAIMQSGSSICPWAFQYDPLETASKYTKQTGHNTQDPYKMYNVLMNMTAEDLMTFRVPRKKGDVVLSENIFIPCVEKEIPGIERFLTDTPYNLMLKGEYNKVPLIIGYNSAEGYMFMGKENSTTIADMGFYEALPRDLLIPKSEKIEIAKKMDALYMKGEKISNTTLVKFSRYEGDSGITFPVISTTEILLKTTKQPIYLYKFDYDGALNLAKKLYGFSKAPGATHADELFYLFSLSLPTWAYLEKEFIHKFTTLWTNFAKHSNPTPSILPRWERATKDNPRLLYIGERSSMAPLWNDEIYRFWNQIYSKYRRID